MAIFIWYILGQARKKPCHTDHTVHVLVQPEIVIMKDTFWGWHFWSWAVSVKIMMLYQTFSGHRFGWHFRMPEVGYRYLAMLAGFDAANFAPNRSDFDVFPLNTPKNHPMGHCTLWQIEDPLLMLGKWLPLPAVIEAHFYWFSAIFPTGLAHCHHSELMLKAIWRTTKEPHYDHVLCRYWTPLLDGW